VSSISHAADDRSACECLLAYLVIEDGLTLAQAVSLRSEDVVGDTLTVTDKAGRRESRTLSSFTAALVHRAAEQSTGTPLVTGRSGRPLTPAARNLLLALARQAGVRLLSVHQLPGHRIAAAA
jgi:integrase